MHGTKCNITSILSLDYLYYDTNCDTHDSSLNCNSQLNNSAVIVFHVINLYHNNS